MDEGLYNAVGRLFEVEFGDGRFLHGGNLAGEGGVHNVDSAESQLVCIFKSSRDNLFACFDVAPSAESPAVLVEQEITLGLAVPHG